MKDSLTPFPVAAIQMVSGIHCEKNLEDAEQLIIQAVQQGAKLVLLPEFFCFMGYQDSDKFSISEVFGQGKIQEFLSQIARQHQIWLIGGTIPLISSNPKQVFNSCLVFNPQGECCVRYDKIHLFRFKKNNEVYDESCTMCSGNQVKTFETPFGRLGLSICYDVRFPELYRSMGRCTLIVVPAAFAYTTGCAHWEVLLRARAIENQAYVLAAAQGGYHENGRRTWGHSLLISPWGEIVAEHTLEGQGMVVGILNFQYLAHVRTTLPALDHRVLSSYHIN